MRNNAVSTMNDGRGMFNPAEVYCNPRTLGKLRRKVRNATNNPKSSNAAPKLCHTSRTFATTDLSRLVCRHLRLDALRASAGPGTKRPTIS